MEKLLQEILKELKAFKNETNGRFDQLERGQQETNERLDQLERGQQEANERLNQLERGQQEIKDHLTQLDTKNADRHLEIINKLSDDIAFIKHKEFKNEEDIFKLKKNIQIIK
jgi:uncharacterized phage infection (PIP) family protein YhgE